MKSAFYRAKNGTLVEIVARFDNQDHCNHPAVGKHIYVGLHNSRAGRCVTRLYTRRGALIQPIGGKQHERDALQLVEKVYG